MVRLSVLVIDRAAPPSLPDTASLQRIPSRGKVYKGIGEESLHSHVGAND